MNADTDQNPSTPPILDPADVAEQARQAEARMVEAEALLDVATNQLAVAARNIANANAAEREYRRTIWHYSQLMRHRISNPLQTIIGMADTLRAMPDLDRDRRIAMLDAIVEQARVLRDVSLEPRIDAPSEHALDPEPLRAIVRTVDADDGDDDTHEDTPPPRSPFTRFPPR